MRIAVIGDLMLDMSIPHASPRTNYEGARTCFTGNEWEYFEGGAANVARILSLAKDVEVFVIGAVGNDWAGHILRDLLGDLTVDLYQSELTTVKLRAAGIRLDCEKKARTYTSMIPFGDIDLFVLCDYAKGVFGANSKVNLLIDEYPVIVSPAICDYYSIWKGAYIGTMNHREAEFIGPQFFDWTLITYGQNPAQLLGPKKKRVKIKTKPMQNPQVIGAGDAVTAALAYWLLKKTDVVRISQKAIEFASEYVRIPRIHRDNFLREIKYTWERLDAQ
jgi:bifunctional ADP-heptose synthase (sugar kinase/adenylyltransferase)